MINTVSHIFQPLQVGPHDLQHRIVLAPLTRNRATADHIPTSLMREYYAQRASTPGTLLITEATPVAECAGGMRNVPGIWNEAQIEGWRTIVDAVHDKGSFIWLQLWALGRAGYPEVLAEHNYPYVSASAIKLKDRTVVPRALTILEIKKYVELFATAARNARRAGFDGVEMHGANGYLIDQFLQSVSNERTDEYGGSIENRIRFADEVVDAVVDAIGADRTAIRLSPWSVYQDMCMPDPVPTFDTLLRRIDTKHPTLAYIHIVEPDAYGADRVAPGVQRSNAFVDAIRLPRPVVHTNGLTRISALEMTKADGVLAGFGRAFLANPDLPRRLEKDLPLNDVDYTTFYFGDHKGYTDYPFYDEGEVKAKA
ncbi:putative NADPH2 dehydrogenase chain OYE2 [Vararia minispora EC-137]|uniref:NADPH2 dehydrogenase chain OYE2 n=1 Tax=Vararia minispora EC-137 TaxID=1314806 RepID=A0ACB8QWV6_9AGAM|nr:putative NADPH2 dehydrogenase chain OYE2 [Vararia minispora EC-137]